MDAPGISDIITIILWLFGIFVAIITTLVTSLYFIGKAYFKTTIEVIVAKTDKNEEWIRIQQEEINKVINSNNEHILIQEFSQKQTERRLELIENFVFKMK